MIVKIVFYKSSSQYYESLCESCRFFETYEQEKSTNTMTLGLDDLREKQLNIKSILTIIKSWSKTENSAGTISICLFCTTQTEFLTI